MGGWAHRSQAVKIVIDFGYGILYDLVMKNNYTCPICLIDTACDEWAKPQIACINCGVQWD